MKRWKWKLKQVGFFLRRNLRKLGIAIIVVGPMWTLYRARVQFYSIWSSEIVMLCCMGIGALVLELDNILKNKISGVPVMRKRFVTKSIYSMNEVSINNEDLPEIITYLADLQEYFQKEGLL